MRVFAPLAVLALAGAANATVYTTQASFLANVQPGFYFNNFTGVPTGAQPALPFGPVNGYSYIIDTDPTPNNLFNDPGIISTNLATDTILITFTGAPVTAVGGNFWATNISFQAIPAQISFQLSNGDTELFNSTAASDFRGFTSAVPILSMTIDAIDPGVAAWTTMDNLYVGQVIPTPGSLALLGLGALAAGRRRR